MTTLNDIIDVIGDTIFSPTVTTNNRNRLQQAIYENNIKKLDYNSINENPRRTKTKTKTKTFDDTLFDEKKKYINNYNIAKNNLKKALVNRKLLKIKTEENKKIIDTLVNDIKFLNYKPDEYDIEDELTLLLND